MLGLESLGESAKPREVYTVIVTTAFIDLAHLRVFECGQLAHDFLDRCARRHDASFGLCFLLIQPTSERAPIGVEVSNMGERITSRSS
jgi:hypothetical protein